MMQLWTRSLTVAAIFAVISAPRVSEAALDTKTYSFTNVTANSVADVNTGMAQLSVTVVELADVGKVMFTFNNVGDAAMSITDVYFDDGTLLGIYKIINETGVSFSEGGSPGNLPGGESIGFETTKGFLADSDHPKTQQNGVNPGESLSIIFDLINGKTYDETIAALDGPVDDPDDNDLRIGIHVQGFAGGGSESFVNGPPNPPSAQVPEPMTLLAWMGLGAFGIVGARFGRKRAA
jgi:hypothetical protein